MNTAVDALVRALPTRIKVWLLVELLRIVGARLTDRRLDRVAGVLGRRLARRQGGVAGTVRANIECVLDRSASPEAVQDATVASLQAYCAHWLELARMTAQGERLARSSVRLTGTERIASARAQGRGVVMVSFHMGRFELGTAAVALAVGDVVGIARTMESEVLQTVLTTARCAAGNRDMVFVSPKGTPDRARAAGRLVRALRNGAVVAAMIDRYAVGATTTVPFLGRRLVLATGPVTLAMRTGAAIIPAVAWQEHGVTRTHLGEEIPVPESGDDASRTEATLLALARRFEGHVRDHPHDWHLDVPLLDPDVTE